MKLILILFISNLLIAQSIISGRVLDEDKKPVEFANVYLKGTLIGTVTDAEGYYEIENDEARIFLLVISYTGYKTIEEKIVTDGISKIVKNVVLIEDIKREDLVTITASAFITDEDKKAVIARPLDVVTTPGAAADINRFFQTLPGVTSVDDGAGLFVRGGNVQETVMEIDGATILHPYKFESPSGGFFGTISPFLTKGSAFFTGALSSEYGNVLSGMVDMQSIGMLSENSYQLGIGLAAISGRADHVFAKDKLTLSMSGNYSDTEAMMKFNNHQVDFVTFPRNYDVNFNLNYQIAPKHSAKLFLFRESNEVGSEIFQPNLKMFYTGEASNQLANLMFKGAFSDRLIYQTNFAYTDYTNKNSIGDGGAKRADKMAQVKFKAEYLLGDLSSFYFGADYRELRYDYEGSWHFHPDSVIQGIKGQTYNESHSLDYFASYAEFKIPFGKDLIFRFGARLESDLTQSKNYLDPRISSAYKLSEFLSISASYGLYHQLVSQNYYLNEQEIDMQRSEAFTFGLNYDVNGQFLIRSEVYYKEYDDLIKKIGAESEQRFNNSGYGNSKGFDFLIKENTDKYEYWSSYSYLKAERNELYFVKLSSPEFDITHNFTTVYKYKVSANYHISGKYVFRSGKPYTFSADPKLQNSRRLPEYHRADISFSYLTQLFNNNLTVFYISLNNVFGRENVLNRRYNSDYSQFFDQTGTFMRMLYFGMNIKL